MFNLFRQKHEPTIVCALPEGGALPFFLHEAWEYEGKVAEIESQQLEFDKPALSAMLRQNGFYLYTRIETGASPRHKRR